MRTPRQEFLQGAQDTLPLIVGAIPFGILFGALAVNAGLPFWAIMGMSLFVFAGSSQFVAAGLVAQGTGVAMIIVTTFVVNLRHGLYSASLGPHMRGLSQRWLLPLAFWLTDESYAVVIQRYQQEDDSPHKHWYYLGSAVFMYCNWQLCTVLGVLAGQSLSGMKEWGLEFAMVVTFIGIVVPLLQTAAMRAAAIVAAVVSLLAGGFAHQSGLLVASLAGIATGWLYETVQLRAATGKRGHIENGDSL